jgi:hypothetical protein
MQATCDADRKFLDVEIKFPGAASDYYAFDESALKQKLERPGFLRPGLCLFGDNAYVQTPYMCTGGRPDLDSMILARPRLFRCHRTRNKILRHKVVWLGTKKNIAIQSTFFCMKLAFAQENLLHFTKKPAPTTTMRFDESVVSIPPPFIPENPSACKIIQGLFMDAKYSDIVFEVGR